MPYFKDIFQDLSLRSVQPSTQSNPNSVSNSPKKEKIIDKVIFYEYC
jgi:hypothetical protein